MKLLLAAGAALALTFGMAASAAADGYERHAPRYPSASQMNSRAAPARTPRHARSHARPAPRSDARPTGWRGDDADQAYGGAGYPDDRGAYAHAPYVDEQDEYAGGGHHDGGREMWGEERDERYGRHDRDDHRRRGHHERYGYDDRGGHGDATVRGFVYRDGGAGPDTRSFAYSRREYESDTGWVSDDGYAVGGGVYRGAPVPGYWGGHGGGYGSSHGYDHEGGYGYHTGSYPYTYGYGATGSYLSRQAWGGGYGYDLGYGDRRGFHDGYAYGPECQGGAYHNGYQRSCRAGYGYTTVLSGAFGTGGVGYADSYGAAGGWGGGGLYVSGSSSASASASAFARSNAFAFGRGGGCRGGCGGHGGGGHHGGGGRH